MAKEVRIRTLRALSWKTVKDLGGDFLSELFSPSQSKMVAILTLNLSTFGKHTYGLEILSGTDFEIAKTIDVRIPEWRDPSTDDKVFLKLLAYSEYVALARNGESNVLIYYYGE